MPPISNSIIERQIQSPQLRTRDELYDEMLDNLGNEEQLVSPKVQIKYKSRLDVVYSDAESQDNDSEPESVGSQQ